MSEDRRRTAQQASRRDEVLRRWIAEEVHPYGDRARRMLDDADLGPRGVRRADDLARLPVTELSDLGDGRAWVLEPTAERIRAAGTPRLRARLLVADVLGRRDDFARRDIDVRYKPVTWTAAATAGGWLLTGWTTSDLEVLTALGRRALAISGVTPADRIACTAAGAGIGALQLELGARDAGVPHLRVGDLDLLGTARPTVLSGSTGRLQAAVALGLPPSVRLLVAHVGAGDDHIGPGALRRQAGRPVQLWWAPAGVRAAWVTCERERLHTWPEHEHLEAVDDDGLATEVGRLVWSPVGWRGSVWLRIALGPVGRVDRRPCACGRTTPQVEGTPRRGREGDR
jgi:hypothetical protein